MKNAYIIRKGVSDKIEINRYRIYRVNDPIQFARLFYPGKSAPHRRAAFMAIYFEIKNAPDQRLDSTDRIAEKYGLHPASVNRARTKMTRLGLITKGRYGWQFCTVFKSTLERLLEVIEQFKRPIEMPSQEVGEKMWVDMAKAENLKENKESTGEFVFGKNNIPGKWKEPEDDDYD